MTLLMKKLRQNDQGLDRVRRDVLHAVKVSEDEISTAAGSAALYDGVRLRIAAGQGQRLRERRPAASGFLRGLNLILEPGSLRWTLTAAAILLLAGMAALIWLPKQSGESTRTGDLLQTVPPPMGGGRTEVPSPTQKPEQISVATFAPAARTPRGALRTHRRPTSHADEVATEFLPLTYTADPTVPESRHVVHVRIPRTALIAFGFPMNVERSGESIRADVVIGDDGLARAIRFIQ